MQLQYRGTKYDYAPPSVEMEPSETVGQYRGLEWRFRNPKKALVMQPNLDLVYRGVPYQTGAPAPDRTADFRSVTQATPNQPSTVVQNMARALMMSHHKVIQRREQSLLGRAAAEVGLGAEAAEHYWLPLQGKISPDFRVSYDRSAVAMS